MPFSFLHRSTTAAPPEGGGASRSISVREYAFIRDLVYRVSRINLGDHKKELVSARLGKRLRATGIPTYAAYIDHLRGPDGEDELINLIDAISTNHTFFLREMDHFNFLAREILPKAANRKGADRDYRIWSAACSTGEEPYSIGIVLAEALGEPPRVPWTCECSDISTRVLEAARRAVYDAERLRHVPADSIRRFFLRGSGAMEGRHQVIPALRAHFRFHRLNLLGGAYPFDKPFHLIFCRNVMIYFDRPTQEDLVGRLSRQLAPGGYLFIGHAESLAGVRTDLKPVKPAIYHKPA
jgi:chemotaxis protein methyltransferase CheR